jgi:membrane dipeptidase
MLYVAEGHRDVYEMVRESLRGNRAVLRQVIAPRLRAGGVGLVVFAICGDTVDHAQGTDRPLWAAVDHLDRFHLEAEQPRSGIRVVRWREDLVDAHDGVIRFLLHFEGGSPLEGSVAVLRSFYRLGVRSIQPVHNRRNQLGDGVAESATGGGLSRSGEATVREMERLGMVIDLAHASAATLAHALRIVTKPIVVSHSNCHALCPHVRNLTDEQLRALRDNGALVGINAISHFIDAKHATLERLVDHVEHLVQLLGAGQVYVGGDFTKFDDPRSTRDMRYGAGGVRLDGLEEADQYPNLAEAIRRRRFSDSDVEAIMGRNLVRYLRQTLPSQNDAQVVSPCE